MEEETRRKFYEAFNDMDLGRLECVRPYVALHALDNTFDVAEEDIVSVALGTVRNFIDEESGDNLLAAYGAYARDKKKQRMTDTSIRTLEEARNEARRKAARWWGEDRGEMTFEDYRYWQGEVDAFNFAIGVAKESRVREVELLIGGDRAAVVMGNDIIETFTVNEAFQTVVVKYLNDNLFRLENKSSFTFANMLDY